MHAYSLQVELKTGETYRGTLVESEDNWNSQMKDITVTGRVRGLRLSEPGLWVRVSSLVCARVRLLSPAQL